MKTRIDYVTNSSSASFIMYIESTVNNIDDFKNDMQNFISDYIKEYWWKFKLQDDETRRMYEKWIEEAKTSEHKIYYKQSLDEFNSDETSRETVLRNVINATASQISTNVFSIEDYTSMLNDLVDDLPHYMQRLIMSYVTGESHKYGIKSIKIKVVDDH